MPQEQNLWITPCLHFLSASILLLVQVLPSAARPLPHCVLLLPAPSVPAGEASLRALLRELREHSALAEDVDVREAAPRRTRDGAVVPLTPEQVRSLGK